MIELLYTLILSLALNIIMFVPAFVFQTDKLTDISYSLTFILLATTILFINQISLLKLILLGMITLWGIRLGAYLLIRIMKTGRDKRFDGIRDSFWKFLSFWTIQGISVWFILVPSLLFMHQNSRATWLTWAGLLIWGVGLLTESFADKQKWEFMKDNKNKGKWIDTGLWKYSRHPNYFGEITCWVGVYLFTFSSLTPTLRLIGIISPLFITALILFFSGIPKLEEYADKRWGRDKKYLEYKRKTSILIPMPKT